MYHCLCVRVGFRGHVPVPSHQRREDGGVQTLAPRPVQEGGPVRVSPRIRHDQDARVLLLLQVWSAASHLDPLTVYPRDRF